MTDQAAYRRYTAEAERFLALARVPQITLNFAEPLTGEDQRHVLDALQSQGFEPSKAVVNGGASADLSLPLQAAQVYATLALAAAQERVQPADRPTDDDRSPTFIVVNNELIKPTEAAVERNVVLTDDRGRRWAAAAGPDELYWEAVLV